MKYTDNEMSTIMLCSHIGMKDTDVKPLSLGEWNKFTANLVRCGLEPKIILETPSSVIDMGYDDEFVERISRLADRGGSVAFALAEYEQRGIYAVTVLNEAYPVMLKKVLGSKKPPVLFYAGDISLAKTIGIGVVGARNVSMEGQRFGQKLVEKAVGEKLTIYSGGARGVDSIAETTAINSGGGVVEFLADSLTSKIKKKECTQSILNGRMLVLSDSVPTVGFSVGRAMNRNKYIYAAAYGTFIVEAEYNKGGTWSGASESIKNKWGRCYIWKEATALGNEKLMEMGGIPYSLSDEHLYDIVTQSVVDYAADKNTREKNPKENEEDVCEQMDIFSFLDNKQ